MKASKATLLAMALLFFMQGAAQQEVQLTEKDSVVKKSWLFTLGINIVDDSGDEFGNLFDIKDGWNMVPYPSRVSIGRYFENGVGLETIATYNKYKTGKIIDNAENREDIDYLALDLRVSYDLNQILGETGFFDPYVGVGVGYTDANNQGRGTYNAIVGFRTWFSDHWGLDLSSTGKWTMNTENSTNHIQHALGLAYRFGVEKGLSRKGEEKKNLLEELKKEQQRKQDSILAQQRAEEEARLMAERLKREKEAAELAAAEKAKKTAEEARRNKIAQEINDLGNIHFRLNSSYLSSSDKGLLDKLMIIMENYPSLQIKIESHADSRGPDQYNQWLSERRARRTADYLISNGLSAERVELDAMGESKLINHCSNGVYCKEEEHRENRRSEFSILKF
ncbi:OmpA family protein [Flagellimonas sp.]|uniref:OmpA family protein n=1 Tax=Flagellimonas sp. TaxID=2058762 RepID=UPI003B5C0688